MHGTRTRPSRPHPATTQSHAPPNHSTTPRRQHQLKMFKLLTFAILAAVARSCEVEDGVTVASSTFPEAAGCYNYAGDIGGFSSFVHEDGDGAILPATREIPETGQSIERWVFFAGAADASTICYTDGYPVGNPGEDPSEVTDCNDGFDDVDVAFSCGCGDVTPTPPTPSPVSPSVPPVGDVVEPSVRTFAPSPVVESVDDTSGDDSAVAGSPTTMSYSFDGVDDDETSRVVSESSSGSVASIHLVGYICVTLLGAFVVL